MEYTAVKVKAKKDNKVGEDRFCILSKNLELVPYDHSCFSKSRFQRMVRIVKFERTLLLSSKKLQIQNLNNHIPKHLVSLDEKYIRRCLESIRTRTTKSTSRISLDLGLDNFGGMNTHDLSNFVTDCSLPPEQWIVGTITGSKSMINILSSPLFQQYGTGDKKSNMQRRLLDAKGSVCSDITNSPSNSIDVGSLSQPQKGLTIWRNHMHGSETSHNRFLSMPIANPSCSDQSAFSAAIISQGRLNCTWKCGIPQYIFSVDNHKEIYMANRLKVRSSDNKSVNYVYLFQSETRREQEGRDGKSPVIGKMKVSTSFTLCPNNSRIMETEFVLFGHADTTRVRMIQPCHERMKRYGFTRKVAKAFKPTHVPNKSLNTEWSRTGTIVENNYWEFKNLDQSTSVNLLDNNLPSNLELAAIVLRDHIHIGDHKLESGGWGLKYLKKIGIKQSNAYVEAKVSSEYCPRSSISCSTSIDILIPSEFHGGPRTNTCPSGLIQRWKSRGGCDCGGWDIGCPPTVLRTDVRQTDACGNCKSLDIFTQGLKQSVPTLKMVKIHNDLYFVQFQTTLSALQSFSIVVANIHGWSSTLHPNNTQVSK